MRVLLLLLLLSPFSQGAKSIPKACTPMDWFWKNTQTIFVDPVIDRLTFVMHPYEFNTSLAQGINVIGFNETQTILFGGEKCLSVGIEGGLDVLVVHVKALTTLTLSFLPVSHALRTNIYAFDGCGSMSALINMPDTYAAPLACMVATDLMHCSIVKGWWSLPWYGGILFFWLALCACAVLLGATLY